MLSIQVSNARVQNYRIGASLIPAIACRWLVAAARCDITCLCVID